MGRRALITGATGFVGGHLAEHLAEQGWRLRALARSSSDTRRLEELGVELHRGDLGDRDALRRAASGVEVVYHLAAANFAPDEAAYTRANVLGTRNVAEAVAAAEPPPRRLVYLSSYAAGGPAPDGRTRSLADAAAPLTAYGRTKLAAEAEVRPLAGRGVEVVIIRAPAVYGPADRALLSYFRMVRWGVAPSPKGGAERLHVVYAPDLARALARAADAPEGTYAVAEPVVHAWSDMVDAIAAAMDRRPLRVGLPRPLVRAAARATQAVAGLGGITPPFNREKAEEMLARAWVCDLSGSEILLPREEATPLSEGIAETVRWYTRRGWL